MYSFAIKCGTFETIIPNVGTVKVNRRKEWANSFAYYDIRGEYLPPTSGRYTAHRGISDFAQPLN